jgi:hypothetical protein
MEQIGPKRVEISAVGSTPEERLATLLAFRERVPIVILRDDGMAFATMSPKTLGEIESQEITPDT